MKSVNVQRTTVNLREVSGMSQDPVDVDYEAQEGLTILLVREAQHDVYTQTR